MKSTLGDVADFINGAAFKPEDWGDEGYRIIRIQNLTDKDKPYNRTTRVVNERINVHPGELLVSWSATLGVFEWDGPDIAYLNQHIFRVVPDLQKVDKRYLRYALELALLDMRQHLHGATMLHVNRGEFLSTQLYLPPLPEQRRIAAILDHADALRAKRREALAQLDSLTKAIFVEMFGEVATSKRFSVGVIRHYVEANSGKSAKSVLTRDRTDIPIYGGHGVNGWAARALYELPVLVVGRVGQHCGNVFITQGPSWVTDNAIVIRISDATRLNLIYVLHALKGTDFSNRVKHLDLPFINQGMILDTPIPIPPLPLQEAFAGCVKKVEALKASHRAVMEEADALFASLQHRAFRGEL